MKKLSAGLTLALLLATSSAIAHTSGDVAAGRAIAMQLCTTCHKVTAEQPVPRGSKAPSFAAVAAMSSTTEIALHAFLSTPHANMPNLILQPQQQDDVIAYILSLRRPP